MCRCRQAKPIGRLLAAVTGLVRKKEPEKRVIRLFQYRGKSRLEQGIAR